MEADLFLLAIKEPCRLFDCGAELRTFADATKITLEIVRSERKPLHGLVVKCSREVLRSIEDQHFSWIIGIKKATCHALLGEIDKQ